MPTMVVGVQRSFDSKLQNRIITNVIRLTNSITRTSLADFIMRHAMRTDIGDCNCNAQHWPNK